MDTKYTDDSISNLDAIKQRAISKIQSEISKDIDYVKAIATQCGVGEIFFFLHYLHCLRLTQIYEEIKENEKELVGIYFRQIADAYKYIIQLLYKYSRKTFVENTKGVFINQEIVVRLTKIVVRINSKYESFSFILIANDIEILDKNARFIKFNMADILKDDRLNKFFKYAIRVNMANDYERDNLRIKEAFLTLFKNEFNPYSDLFESVFGVALEQFIQIIDFIFGLWIEKTKELEKSLNHLGNGKIHLQTQKNILLLGSAMLIKKQTLIDRYGPSVIKILEKLYFQVSEFDEQQLRYNLIARQPILEIRDELLISPELLIDSLLVNSHYSILETPELKEVYIERYAEKFIDSISVVASKFDYTEIGRTIQLYEEGKSIGDIDIAFRNSNNHYLLVESKNHALPLDVYFHDQIATEKRLNYLTDNWEKKVDKRFKHLKEKYADYNIGPSYTYVMISKYPEILSHFSSYLVLTLREFEFWLSQKNLNYSFQQILDEMYKITETTLTDKQIEQLYHDLDPAFKFIKE